MLKKIKSPHVLPFLIVSLALVIKFSLFILANTNAPSTQIQIDSRLYLDAGKMIAEKGVFAAHQKDGTLSPVTVRTPGYSLFIAVFHNLFNIPLTGIILIQIGFTLFSAWVTYKTAVLINPRYGFLTAVIVLYDLPTTVCSLMLLTESLFVVFLTLFMLNMVIYLKEQKFRHLIFASILLVFATFVRPLIYYLPVAVALFIITFFARTNLKRGGAHALLFCLIIYACLFPWQIRNHQYTGQFNFSTIRDITMDTDGLYKSYARNKNTLKAGTSPILYYTNVTARSIINLMTYPGTLKYFGSQRLKFWGKVIAYPWVVFWMTGFIVGFCKSRHNPYLIFLLVVAMYFLLVTVFSTLSSAMGRFRIPMMPFLAIISAHGWYLIILYVNKRNLTFT
ncbi:MAG: glycosyltransferase family 39 protein [Candidatus Omnitrophota bacterium]